MNYSPCGKVTLAFLLIGFLACKKETTVNNIDNNTSNLSIKLSLIKIKNTRFLISGAQSSSYEETMLGTFKKNNTINIDAGNVYYSDSVLNFNGHTYMKSVPNPNINIGFTNWFDGVKLWSVTGNTSNGVPAFSETNPSNFPSFILTDYSTLPVVDRSMSYTVNWDSSIPADSLWINLSNNGKSITSGTISGSLSSYTFNPSQLSVLDTSAINSGIGAITTSIVQIFGVIYKDVNKSGVPVRVINQAIRSTNVNIR